MRSPWSYIGLAFPLAFIAFVAYQLIVGGPKARAAQARLQAALLELQVLPGATEMRSTNSWKPGQALASRYYKASAPYAVIVAHYEAELAKQGWVRTGESRLRDWGRDLGGRTVEWRRNDFTASVEYAGERSAAGWDYALSLSWHA
jgi:hypothetical protein